MAAVIGKGPMVSIGSWGAELIDVTPPSQARSFADTPNMEGFEMRNPFAICSNGEIQLTVATGDFDSFQMSELLLAIGITIRIIDRIRPAEIIEKSGM